VTVYLLWTATNGSFDVLSSLHLTEEAAMAAGDALFPPDRSKGERDGEWHAYRYLVTVREVSQ
jgi:hypothetical protein